MPLCDVSPQQISILLVDDDLMFRQGLRTLIEFYSNQDESRFQIVGETSSAEQAVKLAVEQHPTLVLLDMELADQDGIAVLTALRQAVYKGAVLVLSGHQEAEWVFRAMQAGAKGYIYKDHLVTQLCTAITTVMQNQIYLSPEVATEFFHLFHFYSGRSLETRHKLNLTGREQEVLHWLIQGACNEEIASHMYVTVATVKAHLTAIFTKLEVTSRTQAIIKALKLGLV